MKYKQMFSINLSLHEYDIFLAFLLLVKHTSPQKHVCIKPENSFTILELSENKYLLYFINFPGQEIQAFGPSSQEDPSHQTGFVST